MNEFEQVGYIDVDAGIVWVGDPCYVFPVAEDNKPGFDYFEMLNQWPKHEVIIENKEEAEIHYRACIKSGMLETAARKLANRFLKRTEQVSDNVASFPHEAGHQGRGICVHSGYGDGSYPVFARYVDDQFFGRRVAEIRVIFISEEEQA